MFRHACSALGLLAAAFLLAGTANSADEHAEMIGKPAPDLKGDFAINGKPVSLSDLKGKVVLLDFWAVWCGPCIATFPHLREWDKEYKDKGLEIVGVTTYYQQFKFDKDGGKLTRVAKGETLKKDEEHDMLKDFAQHHKLTHRLMTLSKEDWMKAGKAYNVEGIPTAVVIDRKGNVQLVTVGSGEKNAKALESKIKELLKEK